MTVSTVAPGFSPHPLPLRACLLSGGSSQRMGQDKGLLPHPDAGSWLEYGLELLEELRTPLTLFTGHTSHLSTAVALAKRHGWLERLEPLREAPPHEGPLLALAKLMRHHPDQILLLCPVDMPWLDRGSLRTLLASTTTAIRDTTLPGAGAGIRIAHDGQRHQPLLGLYPSDARHRDALLAATASGERSLQRWIAAMGHQDVGLAPAAIANANTPAAAARLWQKPGWDPEEP